MENIEYGFDTCKISFPLCLVVFKLEIFMECSPEYREGVEKNLDLNK